MIVLGLTGSFGTGKTFVASIFARMGARVIDADAIAHRAILRGTAVYSEIVAAFGSGILDNRRNIDRKRLAWLVFGNRRKLAKLERIVHPVVIKEIKERMAGLCAANGIVVIDAPLLIEAHLAGIVDALIVVKTTRPVQVARCRKKFLMETKEILARIASQMPLRRKMAMADFVIDNNGQRSVTAKQVKNIWRRLHGNSRT